jgi:hypothetical protein
VFPVSSSDPGLRPQNPRGPKLLHYQPRDISDARLAYPKWLVGVNVCEFEMQLPAAFCAGGVGSRSRWRRWIEAKLAADGGGRGASTCARSERGVLV